MSEFTPTNGQPIPGCRMRMIRVKTDKFKQYDVLARFAANIKGVTAYKRNTASGMRQRRLLQKTITGGFMTKLEKLVMRQAELIKLIREKESRSNRLLQKAP